MRAGERGFCTHVVTIMESFYPRVLAGLRIQSLHGPILSRSHPQWPRGRKKERRAPAENVSPEDLAAETTETGETQRGWCFSRRF